MNIAQKDIVLFPFSYTNFSKTKIRPAIILSNNNYNRSSEDLLIVAITSVIKDEPYSITINNKNLEKGFIIKKSRVKSDHIFTVDKKLIKKVIGRINNKTFNYIKKDILKLINIP